MSNLEYLSQFQKDGPNGAPWAAIAPLPPVMPKAPRMTQEIARIMLPKSIQDWILDYSHRAQVPIESASVCALGSIASIVGRKIGIYPKMNDSFWVPCVFWTAIVARPGERKSSIISFSQKPFDKLENLAGIAHKTSIAGALARKEVLKQKIDDIKERMKVAAKSKGNERIEALEVELKELLEEEQAEPQERRYRTNDATVEKLGEILNGNPRGILVVRDELIGWIKGFDKPGREGDRSFFLEGWDASGAPFSVDRIGRKRVVVESLCLHVMGGIQPGKMEEYVKSALNGGDGDDGFLQRFQLMVYPEPPDSVNWVDEKPNVEAIQRVQKVFDWLDSCEPSKGDSEKFGLRFSPEAQTIYQQWSLETERRFRLGAEEHPAFVSHLSKYLRLMPALALLFHLVDCADSESLTEFVSGSHARMAAAWCEFLEAHARKVYAIVEKQEIRDAEAILRRIKRKDITDGMSIRDVAQKGWAPFGCNPEAIKRSIESVLEPYGYCRIESTKQATGRPSEVIKINPELKRG